MIQNTSIVDSNILFIQSIETQKHEAQIFKLLEFRLIYFSVIPLYNVCMLIMHSFIKLSVFACAPTQTHTHILHVQNHWLKRWLERWYIKLTTCPPAHTGLQPLWATKEGRGVCQSAHIVSTATVYGYNVPLLHVDQGLILSILHRHTHHCLNLYRHKSHTLKHRRDHADV